MGKRKLSLRKHPHDEQIQAISAAQQQREERRGEGRRREEKRGEDYLIHKTVFVSRNTIVGVRFYFEIVQTLPYDEM